MLRLGKRWLLAPCDNEKSRGALHPVLHAVSVSFDATGFHKKASLEASEGTEGDKISPLVHQPACSLA